MEKPVVSFLLNKEKKSHALFGTACVNHFDPVSIRFETTAYFKTFRLAWTFGSARPSILYSTPPTLLTSFRINTD